MNATQRISHFLLTITVLATMSCSSDSHVPHSEYNGPVFELLSPSHTNVRFSNKIAETVARNIGHFDNIYNGAGLGIVDINNDGLQDIFFAGNDVNNELYLNKGNLEFEDISKAAGIFSDDYATGVSIVDINLDGYMDIYVSTAGPDKDPEKLKNKLYVNNKDLTFTEKGAEYGVDVVAYSTNSVFFDYDNDGDLDLLLVNNVNFKGTHLMEVEKNILAKGPEYFRQVTNMLLLNEGGKYRDVTESAGILNRGFSLASLVYDFNDDGFLDLFIANDYYIPDFLYMNNGDGTFTDAIKSSMKHISYSSMGCDIGDINNDGLTDLMVADMTPADHVRNKVLMASMDVDQFSFLVEKSKFIPQYMFNSLQLNKGGGLFSEVSHATGTALSDWSWAVLIADYTNTGWKDIYVTNGFRRDTKNQDWIRMLDSLYKANPERSRSSIYFENLMTAPSQPIPNVMYHNNGNLDFKDVAADWGMEEPSFSNGAAYADLDNDGDLDLVVNNYEQNAFVYQNHSEKSNSNYIQFVLKNKGHQAGALNAKIKIQTDSGIQVVDYLTSRGYMSSVQEIAHFGLGQEEEVQKVEITWADRTTSIIEKPEVNKTHHFDKAEQKLYRPNPPQEITTFMNIAPQAAAITFIHKENQYDDFATEVLLPHKQSTLGPGVAVGDINNDGLEDFYIGGAKDQTGQIYLQDMTVGFKSLETPALKSDSKYEDTGARFLDIDNDGDLDLYVCSGGGADIKDVSLLQDRIYINNGAATFTRSQAALPKIVSSTKAIAECDWDGDGDLDLFIGGRTTPGAYPVAPSSYLLLNEKGKYKDVTASLAPDLMDIGMVTDAIWANVNKDSKQELIISGEWMPISTFGFDGNKFSNITEGTGLKNLSGWWYSLAAGDIDNDGDLDIIAGNLGKNNKFHPSKEKPFHIFSNDFDDSGSLDIVLSKTYKGNLVPVRGKECSSTQMPYINEKFPTYEKFATASMIDIYGEDKMESGIHYEVTTFEHAVFINDGTGNFTSAALPIDAQLSPVHGIVLYDFNRDGNLDLLLGGNTFNTEVETAAYDAGTGTFLLGKGDGNFSAESDIAKTGLVMNGNAKDLLLFKLGPKNAARPAALVANNNAPLQLFAYTK